jgi:PBSX family phage terminase large subunit
MLALTWLEAHPGVPFGVAADTFGKLQSNFIAEFQRLLGEVGAVDGEHYRHNKVENKFYWYNGASLQGFTMDKPPEKTKGPTLGGVIFDEADQITEAHYDIFSVCARDPRGPRQVVVLANPVPPAHWVNKRFSGSTADEDAELVRVTSYDNPFLPVDQIRQLERQYPPGTDLHRRWVLGQSVAMQGAVYPSFDPLTHVVDQVPPLRGYAAGLDLGVKDPSVLLIGGLDDDGRLYILAEYVSREGDPPQVQAVGMKRALAQFPPMTIFSDHSLTFRTALEHEGVRTVNAEKDRASGIALVSRRVVHRYVFIQRGAAPTLEESIQLYRWKNFDDPAKVIKDETEHQWSHAPDALRYLVVGLDNPERLRW